MKRLLLAFLLLGLTTLLVPDLRHRAEPHIDTARVWLGQKLEGPLTPVLTPYRTIKTQSQIGEVTPLLIRARNTGQPLPQPDDFAEYLVEHDVVTVDAWGVPLVMDQERDSVAIISAGPDLQYDTGDDIIKKIRDRDPGRRRPGWR